MSICNLDSKKAEVIMNYVNALVHESLEKDPIFDYNKIVRSVYDRAYLKNKDQEQALGMAYHVPQMLFDLVNKGKLNIQELLSKDFDSKGVNNLIKSLKDSVDPINTLGKHLGVISVPQSEIQKSVMNTPLSGVVTLIKVDKTGVEIIDKKLSSKSLLNTSIEQTKLDKNTRSSSQTNPRIDFHVKVLQGIIQNMPTDTLDNTRTTYGGHTGFRLKLERESNLSQDKLYPWDDKDLLMLVLVDNKGKYLYFDKDGKVTTEDKGKIVYFVKQNYSKEKQVEKFNSLASTIKNVSPEEKSRLENLIKKQINNEVRELKSIEDDFNAGKLVLLDITEDSSAGIPQSSGEVKYLNQYSLDSSEYQIQFERFGKGELPSIKLSNYPEPFALYTPDPIGKQDPGLLDNIVSVLSDNITLLGEPITAQQRKDYADQFFNTTGKPLLLTVVDSKLIMEFNGKNIDLSSKQTIRDLLGALDTKDQSNKKLWGGVRITFKKGPWNKGTYYKYDINNGVITDTKDLDYKEFIFSKSKARDLPFNNVTEGPFVGKPMIVNGYFNFKRADNKLVEEDIKETQSRVPKEASNITYEGLLDDLERSKLVASRSNSEQRKKAEEWVSTSPLFKARDSSGNPLFQVNRLYNTVNSDAWATFSGSAMTLYKGSDSTHLYHEAWHAFSQLYLTYNERTNLYNSAKNQPGSFEVIKKIPTPAGTNNQKVKVNFKDATRQEIEEHIAEEFRIFAMNEGKFKVKDKKPSLIKRIFSKVWDALKALFKGSLPVNVYSNSGSIEALDEVFNNLYNAKDSSELNNLQPGIHNAEFGSLNSGIIDEQGNQVLSPVDMQLLSQSIDGIISAASTEYVKNKNRYGLPVTILSRSNRSIVYNNLVKNVLQQRLDKMNSDAKVLEQIGDTKTPEYTRILNGIRILSTALKPEYFGDLTKVSDKTLNTNNVISHHLQNSAYREMFNEDMFNEDRDPTESDIDTEDSSQSFMERFDRPSNGIESEKIADIAAKYLVRSLIKLDKNNTPINNDLGFPQLVDFLTTWNILMDKASGELTLSGLYNKLAKAKKDEVDPLFGQLIDKLGDPGVVQSQSKPGYQLWIKLWQSLNLARTDHISLQFAEKIVREGNEDPTTQIEVTIGKTSSPYFKFKRDWSTQFSQASNVYIIKTNGVNYLNLKKISDDFLTKRNDKYELSNSNMGVSFLRAIGIYLEDNNSISNALRSTNREDVLYIADAIGKASDSKKQSEITDPIKYLSEKSSYHTPLVARVNNLAQLQADYSLENSGQMRPIPGGKTGDVKSVYSLNSTLTTIVDSLNKVSNKRELLDPQGDFKHMNSINPEINPETSGNIILNSLFKSDGSRSSNINIFDAVGVQYVDNSGTKAGTGHGATTGADKFIIDFTSLLLGGYIEGIRPGDKGSFWYTKVGKLSTYSRKNTDTNYNHLYIRTIDFLKSKNGTPLFGVDPFREFLNLIYPKLQGELRRIKMMKDDPSFMNNVEGFANSTKLTAFDDILNSDLEYKNSGSLKDYLTSNDFLTRVGSTPLSTILQNDNDLRSRIDSEIRQYFTNLKNKYETNMFDTTFIKGLPDFLKDTLTKDTDLNNVSFVDETGKQIDPIKDAALWSFTLNAWLHKSDVTNLFNTDTFQFNHSKDEITKREGPYQSSGRIFATDNITQDYIRKFVRRDYEASLGLQKIQREYDGTMNKAIIKESIVYSDYVDLYKELATKYFKKKGYSGKELQEALENWVKPYTEIKDGDGQGWISFDSYRILHESEGNWSDYQEKLYQKIVNGETIPPETISQVFPVYKLGYAGPLVVNGKYPVQAIDKFSLLPLIPSVIKGTPLERIHKEMISQDVDYITFVSGTKQSYIKANPSSKGDAIYEDNTSNLKDKFEFTKNPLYVTYLKNQTAVNREFKGKATLSSQLRLIVNAGMYQDGHPIDYQGDKESWDKLSDDKKKEISPIHRKSARYNEVLHRLIDYKRKDFLEEMGWKETKKDEPEGQIQDMLTYFTKYLKKQGLSDHELEIMQTDSNIDVDLSLSSIASRLERLMTSAVNNNIVRVKVKGEAFVQVSGTFQQKFKKPSEKDLETYGTNGLRSYIIDPNGKENTKACQVKVALTENFQNLDKTNYFEKNDKGEYVDTGKSIAIYKETLDIKNVGKKKVKDVQATRQRLNEMLKVKEWLDHDDNRKKITITGVRIPVQGANSTEFAEVAEFLPTEAGPIIIIPAEIVAKSGGDFDVDKMTMYISHITRRGSLLKDNYSNKEELQKEIDNLKEKKKKLEEVKSEIVGLKDKKDTKWLLFKEYLDSFRDAIMVDQNHTRIGEENLQSITSKDNKELITNLSTPEVQDMLKLFFPDAYKIYNESIKGIKENDLENYENVLDTLYNEKSELSSVYKDLSNAMEHIRSFTAGIQNELVEATIDILSSPEMAFSLLTPNDTGLVKPIADEMKPKLQRADNMEDFTKSVKDGKSISYASKGISPSSSLREDYNLEIQQNNFIAKKALAIAAIDNKFNNQFNISGAVMKPSFQVPVAYQESISKPVKLKKEEIPIDIKLNHNKENGAISLSSLTDADNKNSIADVISQLMNGFLDVGKDAWVAYIQGNTEVVPKILWMIQAGVPIRDIAYFVNNPMTRLYIKEKVQRKSVLHKLIYGLKHNSKMADSEAKKEILRLIPAKSDDLKKELSVKYQEYDDQGNFLSGLTNGTSIWGISKLLEEYSKPSYFTTEGLQGVAYSKFDSSSEAQKAGFLQYLYIEDLIKDYDQLKRDFNYDTKVTNDPVTAKAKQMTVDKAMNLSTMDPRVAKHLRYEGPVAPFGIQKLIYNLIGKRFKLRNDNKITNYIISQISDSKKIASIKKETGMTTDTYGVRFQNAISQYAFTNELRQYKLGESSYKGIDISKETIDKFTKEFNLFKTSPDDYVKLPNHFSTPAIVDSNLEDYLGYSLERAYLRRLTPLTQDLISSVEFKGRKGRLQSKVTGLVSDNNVYENWLMNQALTNNYNIWQLFRSGENTIARELLDIITNYPNLLENPEYSLLKKFIIRSDQKDRNLLNFQISDYRNLDQDLVEQYNKQWSKLADPGIIKLEGTKNIKANKYISDFFSKLSIVAFLQTGMDPSEFSMNSIIPSDNYMRVMEQGSKNFLKRLQKTDAEGILRGFDKLFRDQNSFHNRKYKGKGLNYRKTYGELLDLDKTKGGSIYEQPFIFEIGDNVYLLENTYLQEDKEKIVPKETIDQLKNYDPRVRFITSLSNMELDLDKMTRQDIDVAINNIKSTEAPLVISSDLFKGSGNDNLLYLSQRMKEEFNYIDPKSKELPTMKDLLNKSQVITKEDIDKKKRDCNEQ